MDFKELIDEFAKQYGIEDYTIENGELTLVVDYTAVTIREATNAKALIVSAVVGGAMPDSKGHFASLLLQANHLFAGAHAVTICQHPDTDEYLAIRTIPHALADVEALADTISILANVVDEWRANRTAFLDIDREANQEDEEAAELNPLFGGYFIRV